MLVPSEDECKYGTVNGELNGASVSNFNGLLPACSPILQVFDGVNAACERRAFLGDQVVCAGFGTNTPRRQRRITVKLQQGGREITGLTTDGKFFYTCAPGSNVIADWTPQAINQAINFCDRPDEFNSDFCQAVCTTKPIECSTIMSKYCSEASASQGFEQNNSLLDPTCAAWLESWQDARRRGEATGNFAQELILGSQENPGLCDVAAVQGKRGILAKTACQNYCFNERAVFNTIDCDNLYTQACADPSFQLDPSCSCFLPTDTYEAIFKAQIAPFEKYFKTNPFNAIQQMQDCQYVYCSATQVFKPFNPSDCQSNVCLQAINIESESLIFNNTDLNIQNVCNNIVQPQVCNNNESCASGVCGEDNLCVPPTPQQEAQNVLLPLIIALSIVAGISLIALIVVFILRQRNLKNIPKRRK